MVGRRNKMSLGYWCELPRSLRPRHTEIVLGETIGDAEEELVGKVLLHGGRPFFGGVIARWLFGMVAVSEEKSRV
jgi:hypothetical protein